MHYRSPGVFSLGGWSPLLHTSFHGTGATQDQKHHSTRAFRLRGCHPLRLAFPDHSAKRLKWLCASVLQPHHKTFALQWFGLLPFRSPLLRESRLISFPRGTKMFQFPRSPLACLCIQHAMPGLPPGRLPHSGIHGSTPACGSPWLFAACHALHRLRCQGIHPAPFLRLTSTDRSYSASFFTCLTLFTCQAAFLFGGLRWTRTTDLTLIRRTL